MALSHPPFEIPRVYSCGDAPVFDAEMTALARMQEIIQPFSNIGQRRRMLEFLINKMVETVDGQ